MKNIYIYSRDFYFRSVNYKIEVNNVRVQSTVIPLFFPRTKIQ